MFVSALLVASVSAQILFNCPKPAALQKNSQVMSSNSFDMQKFAPSDAPKMYYEIAYKDMTQPRICDCITSEKSYNQKTDQVIDTFTIECANSPYKSNLVFNATDAPGVFTGIWNQAGIPILSALRFPDTVVDVGVNPTTGEYDWVVEFQCDEVESLITFYAFNFYSSVPGLDFFHPMMDALNNAGLGRFLNEGNALQMVNQTETCWYNKK